MPPFLARFVLSALAAFAFALIQSDGCGYEPPPEKGLGEPCTRSSECEASLVCSGGVCMEPSFDAGDPPPRDAGDPPSRDAGFDASTADASVDAAIDAAADAAMDASDGASPDSGAADAAPDGSLTDAAADADASADGGGA